MRIGSSSTSANATELFVVWRIATSPTELLRNQSSKTLAIENIQYSNRRAENRAYFHNEHAFDHKSTELERHCTSCICYQSDSSCADFCWYPAIIMAVRHRMGPQVLNGPPNQHKNSRNVCLWLQDLYLLLYLLKFFLHTDYHLFEPRCAS